MSQKITEAPRPTNENVLVNIIKGHCDTFACLLVIIIASYSICSRSFIQRHCRLEYQFKQL